VRKSSYEIADLQQTAQIIPAFCSSFLPHHPKAGQIDGNPVKPGDCTDPQVAPNQPVYLICSRPSKLPDFRI
jgi:hypothetical protein